MHIPKHPLIETNGLGLTKGGAVVLCSFEQPVICDLSAAIDHKTVGQIEIY